MINADFMVLRPFVLHQHCQASLFSARPPGAAEGAPFAQSRQRATRPSVWLGAILEEKDFFMALIPQPHTAKPFASFPELDDLRENLTRNVPAWERVGSIALGAGFIIYGISRRSLWGGLAGLAGAALVARGASGRCLVYRALGSHANDLQAERHERGQKGIRVTQTINVEREPAEVFRYWRKLENLARFMEHVESVEEIDSQRSHWVVRGPLGQPLHWDARIVNESEGEMIAWESLPGAEVNHAGSVWFEPDGRGGTSLKVILRYYPPAGQVGAATAQLLGESPEQQLAQDLSRFKEIIEQKQDEPAQNQAL